MKGVIANSFPKSGTHILTSLLRLLGYTEANTHLSRSLVLYGPRNLLRNWQIKKRLTQYKSGIPVDIENHQRLIKKSWLTTHITDHLKDKKYVQGHLPFSEKMEQIIIDKSIPALYIHRNPKDVLVSMKNYILKKKNHPNHKLLGALKTERDRFEVLLSGYRAGNNINTMAPFFTKYAHSIAWNHSDSVCAVEFEKIIGPKGGGSKEEQLSEIQKIVDYLNCERVDVEQLAQDVFNPHSETFNKGIIGQWQQEFDDYTYELYDRYYRAFTILNEP